MVRKRTQLGAPTSVNQQVSRCRMLVVDDEPIIPRFPAQILVDAGYEVLTAVDGLEAHRIASQSAAELGLVLTDIRMPNLDGLALGRAFATLRPDLPVLYMSGFGAIAFAADLPGSRFIRKPFNAEQLLADVRGLLLPPNPSPK
jgi:DNA-binding NtrC family response regulator